MVRQDFLVEEAEESDEELMAGFGYVGKKGEEGEEAGGADLDAALPELVDDQKMDEETEGIDKVMEKHKCVTLFLSPVCFSSYISLGNCWSKMMKLLLNSIKESYKVI